MNGVDLAYPQKDTDFNTLKDHVGFVMIKATDGVGLIDAQFSHNRQGARDVDLPRMFYHFAEGGDPRAEAQHFIDIAAGALQPGEGLALDWEISYAGDPVAWCKTFLDYVFNATGVRPLIYSFISRFTDYNWAAVGPYAIWVAAPSYGYGQPIPNFPYSYVMQQYGTTNVPGVNGSVDVDHFFGDATAFKALGKPAPQPEPVAPGPKLPPQTPPPPVAPPVPARPTPSPGVVLPPQGDPSTPPFISQTHPAGTNVKDALPKKQSWLSRLWHRWFK